ncbi:MAG: hypothetical protein Q9222_003111 [Ikaeria aurantiellina]
MADPVSLSASIAGLVTLAELVFKRIFKYAKAVKGASKEINSLLSEVGALYSTLSSLELVSRQLEDESFHSATRAQHLHTCTQTLENLRATLDKEKPLPARAPKSESLKRKLHWPFASSEVNALLAEIERHKTSLGLALNVDSMSGFLQSLSIQGKLRDSVDEIKNELKRRHEAETRIALNDRSRRILKSFGDADPSRNQRMGLRLRQLGTGLWFIESQAFRHWVDTDGAKLWLHGIPGAGKTVLAATIIEEILSMCHVNHAVAFFYCDYKDPTTQRLPFILGSLIQQLAKQDEQGLEIVQNFYNRKNPQCNENPDYDSEELRDLIMDLASVFNRVTVVVDGLDECGANAADVTESLASLHAEAGPTNIKTLFLSRYEVDVRQYLGDYVQIAIAARSSDLRLYVGAEIHSRTRNHKLRVKDPDLKEYIMEKLVEGAEGIISDELEILRWCSSLLRKSADGKCLELAHFTVKEFVLQIEDDDAGEFALYRVGAGHSDNELAKVCLTYLHFDDFNQVGHASEGNIRHRFETYPFRVYAIAYWSVHAQDYLHERDLFTLVQHFLSPSKPGTLVTWAQDLFYYTKGASYYDIRQQNLVKSGIAQATALHFAALLDLPEVCTWLIESGCDANHHSVLGTPLHCSLMTCFSTNQDFDDEWMRRVRYFSFTKVHGAKCVSILLEAGADPNCHFKGLKDAFSPLFMSLYHRDDTVAIQLLEKGGILDSSCLQMLENKVSGSGAQWPAGNILNILENAKSRNSQNVHRSQILDLARKAAEPNLPGLLRQMEGTDMSNLGSTPESSHCLHTAAEFGQVEPMKQILGENKLDLETSRSLMGFTALHYACMGNHPEAVRTLLAHGASYSNADFNGRTAIHHAIKNNSLQCLEVLLETGISSISALPDNDGFTSWHWAAQSKQKQALDILLKYSARTTSLRDMRAKNGWTPLLCAASVGSVENLNLLLHVGCTIAETAEDGSTPLHHAAMSGSLEAVQLLLDQGSDAQARTASGLTVFQYALDNINGSLNPMHDLLIRHGLDSPQALRALADVWQHACLKDNELARRQGLYSHLITTMQCVVAQVPQAGPLHDVCSDPALTISALSVADEELVNAFLKHDPDVDCTPANLSIVKAACYHCCSSILLEDILSRSKTLRDKWSGCGLILAACRSSAYRKVEIVRALLNLGFGPNERCPISGESPLMIAASTCHVQLIELLLSNGADVHALDKRDYNVVHHACVMGHFEAIQILKDTEVEWTRRVTCVVGDTEILGTSVLHLSAMLDDSHILEYLIDEGLVSDINIVTDDSKTALFIAAWFSRPTNVSSLLSRNADATIMSGIQYKLCPIHLAAYNGDEMVIAVLLDFGCDVELLDGWGLDSELIALERGHKKLANLIRKYKEQKDQQQAIMPRYKLKLPRESEALMVAIELADVRLCESIVEDGASLDDGFSVCHGCRPLLYSLSLSRGPLQEAQLEVSEYLALQGASVEGSACSTWAEKEGLSPLQIAAKCGHLRITRSLIESGARIDATDTKFKTPLHYAATAADNRTALCKLLLDHGGNVHAVDVNLQTACILGAQIGDSETVQLLTVRGANLQMRDDNGWTALRHAVRCGDVATVHFIIRSDSTSLGDQDLYGLSPILDILFAGTWHELLFFINLAPDPSIYLAQTNNCLTAAMFNSNMTASLLRKFLRRLPRPVVTRLLKYRARVGGTPLYAAATTAHSDVQHDKLSILLQAGAELDQEGGEHGTPLMGACATGRLMAVKLLVAKGAKVCYKRDGEIFTVMNAAKHFPEIIRWFLVERYMCGPRRICQ